MLKLLKTLPLALYLLFSITSPSFADNRGLFITEADGSPAGFTYKLTVPNSTLSLSSGLSTYVSPWVISGTDIYWQGGTGLSASLIGYSDAAGGNSFNLKKARGSSSVPAASILNDVMGGIYYYGYDATAFTNGVSLIGYAAEKQTDSAQGMDFRITTKAVGGTTQNTKLIVDNGGKLGLSKGSSWRPVNDISINGNGTRTMGMERRQDSGVAGSSLTIPAGGSSVAGRILTFSVTTAGSGYTLGDVITLTTGNADGKLLVNAVDGSGGVTGVAFTFNAGEHGTGYSASAGQATSGGTGTNCTITVATVTTATNKNGGNLVLQSGISTGTGTSQIILQTYPAGASGSADNAATTALTIDGAQNSTFVGNIIASKAIRVKCYTVATLPSGTQGDTACVTDADSPTYLGALTGSGATVAPVFYNGSAWVSH